MKLPDPILKTRDPELLDWIDATNLLINSGKYEFPIQSDEPGTTKANEGESIVVATGETRKLEVYINGLWCTINFTTGGAVSAGGLSDRIVDADGNTAVITEFSSNEDVVRFYANGAYVMAVSTYGLQIASGYKIAFNGLAGNSYVTYNSSNQYVQTYINGALRMEI